jgi:hypothetical protein
MDPIAPQRRLRHRRAGRIAACLALLAGLAAYASSPALAVNGGSCSRPYAPVISPADFADSAGAPNAIDNTYFPLVPGTTFTYEGVKDEAPLLDVMTVTPDTRTIMGVTVTVVRDTAYSDGVLAEDTFDWYAQDDAGNVWYFGEDTTEFDENGNVVTTEGSWEAGQGPNLPGLLMPVQPRSGHTYRQEYAPDVAVDMATPLSLVRHITVPAGRYGHVVMTKEFSCLERGIDHKFYAPGVGLVAELAVSNGREWIKLVGVIH